MAENKTGLYICTDCGIGESINVENIKLIAEKELKVPVCKIVPFLCNQDGIKVIKDDLVNEGVTKIVIAACSPRVNTDKFDFDPLTYVTERVNIREQVVWSQPVGAPTTQLLADDYVRMGIVRAQKSSVPEPVIAELCRTILVVGGGVTGINAALDAAKAGSEVIIVEKENELGGWLRKMYKVPSKTAPYSTLVTSDINAKIEQVKSNPKIKVLTGKTILSTAGEPGKYTVTIGSEGASEEILIGAIVLAAGFRPYDANKLGHLGYGKFKNVVTNMEMEEIANSGSITRRSDGKPAKNVVFIQCAGQRDNNHVPYCSSVCCNVSLKQALYVRELNPDAGAYIIYKDMRTMGLHENFYKAAQDDEGIFLAKGEVLDLKENADGTVEVTIDNKLLGKTIKINADLVVLAVGMVTNSIPTNRDVNDLTPDYVGAILERETSEGIIREIVADPNILNLKYRQGPEMPHIKHGFPDSHFICFPYETRRTGIYAAGAVRHPMDAVQASSDGTGAALKAIQCITLTEQGKAVHPRTGDMTVPEFRLDSCTQCRRCTVECPFGVLDEDEKGTPKPNPYRCRRCGTCMGACPQKIISFKDYSVDMVASMIKAAEVPDEGEEPYILGFICENDAYPAMDMAGMNRLTLNPNFRFITLRCLGGTNLVWIADALAKGIDGVYLIGCKHGDDYQCHFVKGSQVASERLGKVQETLSRLSLEAERVEQIQLSITDWDKLPELLNTFSEKLKAMGPNPYKGF